MVDVRLPERWLNDRRILLLGAEDFRTYVIALMWAVANRTDGSVTREDLALMPRVSDGSVQRFTDLGLWTPDGQGWLIDDFSTTQTSKHDLEVLENARRRDREKKQRQRSSSSSGGESTCPSFGTVPGDVPGDVSQGHDRQAGKAGKEKTGSTLESMPRTASKAPTSTSSVAAPVSDPWTEPGPWADDAQPAAEALNERVFDDGIRRREVVVGNKHSWVPVEEVS
ncbi:hypothetical protein [Rathayibacter rathayi]|uniref:hypothetical protein n=1 Tax=Rathayibacter rathayi TaxID=33887 RepID=UPI000BD42460|nr:hypothetical protein [Rathayibacter rathayi]MWV74719.1 hypothetical protein [Rathayibacter rathayi NCPPB 2980 = VKM Ac-1601]TWD64439.1 hypothetical protein FB469_2923 [Rathayibacter rathayi]SOE04252.1 hypothetical protein SAMN06295924_103303 [Rathayibacter rathayi NCPPB 2980 = VKM Ac-1601]